MSATVNRLGTVSLLALVMGLVAPAAHAQGLDSLFNRAKNEATAPASEKEGSEEGSEEGLQAELEREIDNRLRAITERIGGPDAIAPTSETLTVEDLDKLQRETNRATAQRTLKETEYTAIRDEIEMLLFLQTTVSEIQAARTAEDAKAQNSQGTGVVDEAQAAEASVDVETLRAQWEAEQAAEAAAKLEAQAAAEDAAERASIPRLQSIKGGAGFWEAEIESTRGVMQFVGPGDALADGFAVESIDSKGVVVRAQESGNRYSLIPSPPLDPEAQGGAPQQAQNMAGQTGLF